MTPAVEWVLLKIVCHDWVRLCKHKSIGLGKQCLCVHTVQQLFQVNTCRLPVGNRSTFFMIAPCFCKGFQYAIFNIIFSLLCLRCTTPSSLACSPTFISQFKHDVLVGYQEIHDNLQFPDEPPMYYYTCALIYWYPCTIHNFSISLS